MSYESPWRDCVKYVYIIESLYSLKAISISIRLEEGNITIFEFWLAVVNITLLLCSEENALLSLHPTTNPGTVSAAMNGTLRRAGNIQKATARCVRPLCALLRSVHERCVYNGAPSLRRIKHYQSITSPSAIPRWRLTNWGDRGKRLGWTGSRGASSAQTLT